MRFPATTRAVRIPTRIIPTTAGAWNTTTVKWTGFSAPGQTRSTRSVTTAKPIFHFMPRFGETTRRAIATLQRSSDQPCPLWTRSTQFWTTKRGTTTTRTRTFGRETNSCTRPFKPSPTGRRANTVLIVDFDEWGGFFEHVAPPRATAANQVDPDIVNGKTLLGLRVPTVIASPFTKGNPSSPQVNDLVFDHTSVL